MIYVISGTNRKNSRSRQVADQTLKFLKKYESNSEIMDLAELPLEDLRSDHYGKQTPDPIHAAISQVNNSDGLVIVTPEYNGSYPGALKYFIDMWTYPISFEFRPVAFVGLGFRWGGLRPVEHLQQVFNYRNAFAYPERVFLTQIDKVLVDGKIVDENVATLMENQARGFVKFIAGLKSQGLHPSQRIK